MARRYGFSYALLDFLGWALPILLFVAFIGGMGYLGYKVNNADDPYFKQASCDHPHTPDRIEITATGITRGCVRTYEESYRITNRLTDYPATLCLGRRGDCEPGHDTPFPGGRLTLRPGETREIKFRRPKYYGVQIQRKYPVTLIPLPDLTATNLDVVVYSQTPPSA